MKKGWILATVIDAVLLIVSGCLMLFYNSSDAYGVAALSDLGRFVVCGILFVLAVLGGIALGIAALVIHLKK